MGDTHVMWLSCHVCVRQVNLVTRPIWKKKVTEGVALASNITTRDISLCWDFYQLYKNKTKFYFLQNKYFSRRHFLTENNPSFHTDVFVFYM